MNYLYIANLLSDLILVNVYLWAYYSASVKSRMQNTRLGQGDLPRNAGGSLNLCEPFLSSLHQTRVSEYRLKGWSRKAPDIIWDVIKVCINICIVFVLTCMIFWGEDPKHLLMSGTMVFTNKDWISLFQMILKEILFSDLVFRSADCLGSPCFSVYELFSWESWGVLFVCLLVCFQLSVYSGPHEGHFGISETFF